MSLSRKYQSPLFSGGQGIKFGSGILSGLNKHVVLPNQIDNCIAWYVPTSNYLTLTGSNNSVIQFQPTSGVSQSLLKANSVNNPVYSSSVNFFNTFSGLNFLSGSSEQTLVSTGSMPFSTNRGRTHVFVVSPNAVNNFNSMVNSSTNSVGQTVTDLGYLSGAIYANISIPGTGLNSVSSSILDSVGSSNRYIVTYDLSQISGSNQIKIYRNGQNAGTIRTQQLGVITSSFEDKNLTFNRAGAWQMATFAIYNRVLTTEEIQSLDSYLIKFTI